MTLYNFGELFVSFGWHQTECAGRAMVKKKESVLQMLLLKAIGPMVKLQSMQKK